MKNKIIMNFWRFFSEIIPLRHLVVGLSLLFINVGIGTALEPSTSPSSTPASPSPLKATDHWNGNEYSRNAILQYEWAKKFFFDHHSLRSDAHVLDIGSGNGINTAKIAALTPEGSVVGIDKSPSMVQTAQHAYRDQKNLSFLVEDAANLSFYEKHKNQFDVVVSLVTLHWVADQNTALKGIFTALKDNGVAYVRLCSKGGDPVQVIADTLSRSPAWQEHFHDFVDPMNRFSVQEYERLLHQEGFSIVRLDDVEDRDRLKNVMALKQQLKSWLPHYHYLTKKSTALGESFILAVVDTYLRDVPPQDDGSIILFDHYLEVIAQKPASPHNDHAVVATPSVSVAKNTTPG